MDSLGDLLLMPWFSNPTFASFREDVSHLLEAMQRYHGFLMQQQNRTASNHRSSEPVRAYDDSWTWKDFEARKDEIPDEYLGLEQHVSTKELYEPECLDDFEPSDRFIRRTWYEKFLSPATGGLSFPIGVYQYDGGNYVGNTFFIWRIPKEKCDRDSGSTVRVLTAIKELIPKYSTRTMRKEFIDLYHGSFGVQPAVLRHMYRFLTNDCSAADCAATAAVDDRVAKFALNSDDPDLIYDLRKLNGRPTDPRFDRFWNEMQAFLDEKVMAVNERRHGDVLYLPLAISVEDLVNQVKNRLPDGTTCPSVSWVRFNFWPSNPHTKAALQYTGRFNIRFKVQQRLLRSQHMDSHYVAHQFKMMREMAVKYRDHSIFLSSDDKAIVPIGEPDQAISAVARRHHGALVPAVGPALKALDHDFHVCGAVPSVCWKLKIPENPADSFYDGEVFITTKDKIFQASSASRHAAETVHILQTHFSSDGVNLDQPILFQYSDGGPYHRTTYISVQLAAIALFMVLDLDMYIAGRTAPSQSYANPAERIMSSLNLALQNVSLQRPAMEVGYEKAMKSLSTIQKVRTKAERLPDFKEALSGSVSKVLDLLEERFSRLRWKGEQFTINQPSSDEDIRELSEILHVISDDLNTSTSRKDAEKMERYRDFLSRHCRSRTYTFQVSTCISEHLSFFLECGSPCVWLCFYRCLKFLWKALLYFHIFRTYEKKSLKVLNFEIPVLKAFV